MKTTPKKSTVEQIFNLYICSVTSEGVKDNHIMIVIHGQCHIQNKPGTGSVRFHEIQFRVFLCQYSLRAIPEGLGGQRYLTVRLYLSIPQL